MRMGIRGASGVMTISMLAACLQVSAVEFGGRFAGEWEWVRSEGGIAGVTQTPATTGHTMMLRFRPGDSVEYYLDGELQRTVDYAIAAGPELNSFTITYSAPLFGGFESQTGSVTLDTLTLVDPCCDGFTYTFAR